MKTTILIILGIYFFIQCCSSNEEESVKGGPKDYAQVKAPRGNDIVFSEVFDDDWQSRWIISESPEFTGIWRVSEADPPYSFEQDKGLIVDTKARKHAISASFEKILNNKDKDLYIQYELRLQKDLDCGGAYIKLLTVDDSDDDLDLKQFNNAYPYTVMFGPDKCGVSNKVHFIIRHKNPVSGKYEEKHLKNPPALKTDTKTHLYTLHILKDNTFKILIDNEVAKSGNLLEDFDPPFNPPEEIDDPDDRKPADWVDEAKISDPDAVKPDDWDETAPATIVDENDQKPDTWLDNEPLTIPDPELTKPEDWDDELDGEWEAPQIPNPKCKNGQCGTWAPRYIANPAYKGKWKAPLIDNPDYIGVWAPRKIPNPYYFVEENPHNLDKMGALGIEIWTMTDGILFDNFIISYNSADIDKFTSETWTKKNKDEESIFAEEKAKNTPPFTQQALDFVTKNYLWIGTGAATLLAIVVALICSGGSSNKKKDTPTPSSPSKKKKAD